MTEKGIYFEGGLIPLYALAGRINSHLASKDFPEEVYLNISGGKVRIEMDIYSGDWKHDHLRAMYLVGEYLSDHGFLFHHDEIITDESLSDTYDALHSWTLMEFGKED